MRCIFPNEKHKNEMLIRKTSTKLNEIYLKKGKRGVGGIIKGRR
jgi:hypothetical protein